MGRPPDLWPFGCFLWLLAPGLLAVVLFLPVLGYGLCLCGLCPRCGRLVLFVVLFGDLLVWVVTFSYVFRGGVVHFLFVLVGLLGSASVAWVGMWASGPGF